MKHSQRGYSLIELSIVLAIIAVVIAGAITGVQSILRSNNVVRVISTTNKAVGAITAKLVRDANYANATLPVLTNAGMEIWDAKDITNAGAAGARVGNPFGGQIWVAPLAADAQGVTANNGYVYTITGIPVAACADVALGLDTLATAVSIQNQLSTAVNAAPTALGATVVKSPGTAMTSAGVAPGCVPAAGNTGSVSISLLIPRS